MLPRSSIAGIGAALFIVLAFTIFRPPATPGPLERDFEAYYAAGGTVNAGGDPYSRAIWAAEARIPGVNAGRDELLPFVGPAAALPMWSLLARLPYPRALGVWTSMLVVALATLLVAASYLSRGPWRDLALPTDIGAVMGAEPIRAGVIRGAMLLMLAVASAPLLGALALGQVALVAAAGCALAVVAYRARWATEAGLASLVAAFQPNLAIVLLARLRSGWDIAVAATAALGFALLSLAFGGGPSGTLAYLHRLNEQGSAERFIAIQYTPTAIAYALGCAIPMALLIGGIVALSALTAAIVIIMRERLDGTNATLVAIALLPFIVPFFHEHDFVIELLAVVLLALRARGRARQLAAIAAVLVLIDWFGLAQRHGAAGQILSLGAALACAFCGLSDPDAGRRGPARPAFATLLGIACIALPLAFAHPAPTWPDMLPAHFHAGPTLDASEVWGAEQRAAGLEGRDPVWGILRAIPLAGCLILTWALVADVRGRRRPLHRAIDPQTGFAFDRIAASVGP